MGISEYSPSAKAGEALPLILARLRGVTRTRDNEWKALCPAHDDHNPSLSVRFAEDGKILIKCHAGCPTEKVMAALGLTMADLFPRDTHTPFLTPRKTGLQGCKGERKPKSDKGSRPVSRGGIPGYGEDAGLQVPPSGLTREALAEAKKIPVEFLAKLGITNFNLQGTPCVKIPFKDENGEEAAVRFRIALEGDDRFRWRKGSKPLPYGLWRLAEIRKAGWLLLVEGESDCWTLWYHGLPALGLPGASTWKAEWVEYLKGLEIYLWQEPDDAGAGLAEKVVRDLPGVKIIRAAKDAKDPSAIYLQGKDLPAEIERLKAEAVPGEAILAEKRDAEIAELKGTPYRIDGGRFVWLKQTRDGEVPVRLANFTAEIVGDVTRDDGAERTRIFEIEGRLADGQALPRISVPAREFMAMNWTAEWGVQAVIAAGMGAKDRLREAIQLYSQRAKQETVFCHLGWRRLGDEWIYLHAGGAIGAEDVLVDLSFEAQGLRRYVLTKGDPVEGMRASLRLLEIAPPEMVLPLWAAVWRAPTACLVYPSFVLWLYGPTGSFKSTIAALLLSHFGGPFTKDSLPGAWLWSENSLERLVFLGRDIPVVIDDYAPEKHPREAAMIDRRAERIIRQVGNRQARGRLQADLRARPETPPNSLVIATGEQLPLAIGSIAARILPVTFVKEKVDLDRLSQAQDKARSLPWAMQGFIEWLRPQMNRLAETLPAKFEALRREATVDGHARLPETVAHLQIGTELGTTYAMELGVMTEAEAEALRSESWRVLLQLAKKHAETLTEERPVLKFLQTLDAIFTQGLGYLADRKEGGRPLSIEVGGHNFGWKDDVPRGDLLGWVDQEALYLIPAAAWKAVNEYLRSTGGFPIRERTLHDLLEREGILVPGEDGRHTCKPRIQGITKRVLVLRLHKFLSLLTEPGTSGTGDTNQEMMRYSASPSSGDERGQTGDKPGTRDSSSQEVSPLCPRMSPLAGDGQTLEALRIEGCVPDVPAFAGEKEHKNTPPPTPCPACHGIAWWRGMGGKWICGICHPPADKPRHDGLAGEENLIFSKARDQL